MGQAAARRFGSGGVLGSQEIRTKRDLKDMGYLYGAFAVAALFLAMIFVFVWARITVTRTGYDISSANAARSALVEKNGRLHASLAKLKAPDRIKKIATDELKLVYPNSGQIITIRQ